MMLCRSATHCNTLHHTTTHCNALQHTATHCNTLQHTTTHCNTLQHTATHCNIMMLCRFSISADMSWHTATHCNTLQRTATRCNTLQYTAIHCVGAPLRNPMCCSVQIEQFEPLVGLMSHCHTCCNTLSQHTATICRSGITQRLQQLVGPLGLDRQ